MHDPKMHEPMPAIDETHRAFPLALATVETIQGAARTHGPNEARAALCAAVSVGAILLDEREVPSRGRLGEVLAAIVTTAAHGGEDGTGTLDALQRIADVLIGPGKRRGADAPHG